jgi:hypothetical protein
MVCTTSLINRKMHVITQHQTKNLIHYCKNTEFPTTFNSISTFCGKILPLKLKNEHYIRQNGRK